MRRVTITKAGTLSGGLTNAGAASYAVGDTATLPDDLARAAVSLGMGEYADDPAPQTPAPQRPPQIPGTEGQPSASPGPAPEPAPEKPKPAARTRAAAKRGSARAPSRTRAH